MSAVELSPAQSELLFPLLLALVTYLFQFIASKFIQKQKEARDLNRLRNESELKRIDWQLGEVFGPLSSLMLCNKAAFTALVQRSAGKLRPEDVKTEDLEQFFGEVVRAGVVVSVSSQEVARGGAIESPGRSTSSSPDKDGKNPRCGSPDRGCSPPREGSSRSSRILLSPAFARLSPTQRDYTLWVQHILQPSNRTIVNILTNKANAFDGGIPQCFTDVMAHVQEFNVILKKWELGDYSHMLPSTVFNDGANNFVAAEFDRLRKRKRMILRDLEGEGEGTWGSGGLAEGGEERLLLGDDFEKRNSRKYESEEGGGGKDLFTGVEGRQGGSRDEGRGDEDGLNVMKCRVEVEDAGRARTISRTGISMKRADEQD